MLHAKQAKTRLCDAFLVGLQLSESLTEGAVPFDATSETPVDEQKTEALGRIQDCIMSCTGPEALSLLRAAR